MLHFEILSLGFAATPCCHAATPRFSQTLSLGCAVALGFQKPRPWVMRLQPVIFSLVSGKKRRSNVSVRAIFSSFNKNCFRHSRIDSSFIFSSTHFIFLPFVTAKQKVFEGSRHKARSANGGVLRPGIEC